jgi:hypothetical protein
MTTTPVQRTVTEIDPLFHIPVGVDELTYKPDGTVLTDSEESQAQAQSASPNVDDMPQGDYEAAGDTTFVTPVEVPDINGIVSQTLRRSAGGFNVVDVVFDIDESANANEYEFRVVKT